MKHPLSQITGGLKRLFGITRRPRTREEFEQQFQRFRDVLESNTRALEIITEMGEILGGDYLFDIQFVRTAYGRLSIYTRHSLLQFDALTQGKYRKVLPRYEEIDRKVRQVIERTEPAVTDLVLRLDEIADDDTRSVGAKTATLASLKRSLPFAVPDGFAVTVAGYEAYLRNNRMFERVRQDQKDNSRFREEIAELIVHGELPLELHRELEKALSRLRSRHGQGLRLAVRSSATGEDGEFSFAGQYRTVLNVPPEIDAVEKAYRKVLASLFSGDAAAYQKKLDFDPQSLGMAVACLVMVRSSVSGVLYTADPAGNRDDLVINAAWGLGPSVVDGTTDADHLVVAKNGSVLREQVGEKAMMTVASADGGTVETPTPEGRRSIRSLTNDQVAQLARAAWMIERRFEGPQDVEWSFDQAGTLYLLQSRPLRMQQAVRPHLPTPKDIKPHQFRQRGVVVQQGVACGRVFLVASPRDIDEAPRGAVLVASHDSSNFARIMTDAAAIITDTGAATSHMASLAREFRLPTIVNMGNATTVLAPGREVTVVADSEGAAVYPGRIEALLQYGPDRSTRFDELAEYRRKRYLLRIIGHLNLIDPLRDNFSAAACRTVHDVLRLIHEKSVSQLIDGAAFSSNSPGAAQLDLPVPAGITVIDIGGGSAAGNTAKRITRGQVLSAPFRSVLAGMTHPGAWRSEAVPLSAGDFLTSMLHAPDLGAPSVAAPERNIAIISREYLNLHIKFGYHYTVIDSFLSDVAKNNHIYFRFAGGATDIAKRSRRIHFIAQVLEEKGFSSSSTGDIIVARISGITRESAGELLELVGRLLAYTRQLDAVLQDDGDILRCKEEFLQGRYELTGT